MQFDLLSVILILFGLFTLYGIIFKPDFYWERGRIQRTRQTIGDKNTSIMYFLVGGVMFIVGALGILGVF